MDTTTPTRSTPGSPAVRGRCPRCGSRDVRPWGRFSGRGRWRCLGCERTYSTFTGTPLHYLKRLDAWPAFSEAMAVRMSVRRTAEHARVAPSTAFRWRHRVLGDWRRRDRPRISGSADLSLLFLARSEKGRRDLRRPPRTHAVRYPLRDLPRHEWVLVAWLDGGRDDRTAAVAGRLGSASASVWLARSVLPTVPHLSELRSNLALGRTLRRASDGTPVAVAPYRPLAHGCPRLDRRFRRWVGPFRGVATRYLPNYLQWFRTELRLRLRSHRNSSRQQHPSAAPPDG